MGLPQRDGRPKLDLSPESSVPNPNPSAECMQDYDDLGMNPLNHPVAERKGSPAENGWMLESVLTGRTVSNDLKEK